MVDFDIVADHTVKIKEHGGVVCALGTITKGLVKRLKNLEKRGQVVTIQSTALIRLARILRRVQKTCCHSNSSEKPSANTSAKISQKE